MSDCLAFSSLLVASDSVPGELYLPASDTGLPSSAQEFSLRDFSLMPRLLEELKKEFAWSDKLLVLRGEERPRLPDLVVAALDTLGPVEGPRDLVLVHSGQTYAPTAEFSVPEVTERISVPIHEEYGLSHLVEHGGTEVLDFVRWAADAEAGAIAVVADRPFTANAEHRVPSGGVVVLLLERGEGAVRVLDRHEHRDPDRVLSGPGPCGYWYELADLSEQGELRPGEVVGLGESRGSSGPGALLEVVDPALLRVTRVEVGAAHE